MGMALAALVISLLLRSLSTDQMHDMVDITIKGWQMLCIH